MLELIAEGADVDAQVCPPLCAVCMHTWGGHVNRCAGFGRSSLSSFLCPDHLLSHALALLRDRTNRMGWATPLRCMLHNRAKLTP